MAAHADASVTAFSMVQLGAVTHTVNNDPRRVPLSHTRNPHGGASVAVPTNAGSLLPGKRMPSAMNAAGTPSVARIEAIDFASAPTIENPGKLDLPLGGTAGMAGSCVVSAPRSGLRPARPPRGSRKLGAPRRFLENLSASNDTQTVGTDLLMTVAPMGTGPLGPYGAALGPGSLSRFDHTVPAGRRVVGFTSRSGASRNALGVLFHP